MQSYIIILIAIPITLLIHEYTKALASTMLGDSVPKNTGKLTLNPIKHLEPIGFICLMFFGYGWGKPTQTSPINYKDKKWGTVLVYALPSIVNLVFGYSMFILRMNTSGAINLFLLHLGLLNMQMAFFNIIPIYPLNGSKILSVLLKPQKAILLAQYEKIFQILLIILLFYGLVDNIMRPLYWPLIAPFIQ